jgi:hypothetical protein
MISWWRLLPLMLLTACSANNCSNDDLQAAFGAGGVGGSGGVGGAGDAGGGGGGGGGGQPCEVDCDADGVCDDLLNDDEHCGACSNSCLDRCEQGACVVTETGDLNVWGIGADADFIYYHATQEMTGNASIRRVDDSLGDNEWFGNLGALAIGDLAVTDAFVYSAITGAAGFVSKLQKSDPSMSPVAWSHAGVFLLAYDGLRVCFAFTAGVRCELFGALQPETTTSDVPIGIAIHLGNVVWLQGDGSLWTADQAGLNGASMLGSGIPGVLGLQIEQYQDQVYVATTQGVWRQPISMGGVGAPVTSDPIVDPLDIVHHGGFLYYSEGGMPSAASPGRLMRVSLSGGEPETLYESSTSRVAFLHVHSGDIYFGLPSDKKIMRRAGDAVATLP